MTGRPSPDSGDIWRQGRVEDPRSERRAGGSPRARTKRRPQRGSRRWLAGAGYSGLALVCLCLAAVVFLLVAPPLDAVRDRLIERVNARTGRTLVIAGPASLSLFPRVAVSLSGVSLLAPEGMEGAPIATIPSLEAEVSLWSLLSRRPQVGRLTLHRPTIELTIDAQGRRNWEFIAPRALPSTAADAGGRDPQLPTHTVPPAERTTVATLERLGVRSVRVVDATLRYRDERSGSRYEIGSLDLVVAAKDLDGHVELNGTLAWRGVQVGFSGTASPLRAILSDQLAQLAVKVSGAPIEAAYEGTSALKGGISAEGKVSIKAPSARALGDWLGAAWLASSTADPLAISGHVVAANGQVTFSPIEATLGEAALEGSLAVDVTGRPSVRGKLQISELDLGRILVRRSTHADVPASQPLATGPAAPPQPEIAAGRKGWSDQAIDPQLLAAADADLALSVGRLIYRDLKTGPSTLSVAVNGGLAKMVLENVELYGGRGQGELTLDGTGRTLAFRTSLNLAGVSVLPLLNDAGGVGWLDGRGTIALALSGHGLSERQIVEALNGKVDVAVAEGAMTGIDIGKIMRTLQRGRLPSLTPAPGDRTPFSELTGTFDIANGAAKGRDLKLVSTHVQLKGEGTIELGPRRIDYTLHAKIAGGPPAEGVTLKIGTLEIPIGIKGPLEAPAFTIVGQEGLTDTLKQIGKNLKSREVQDAIKGLLRGDGDKRVKPRELIDKLLKKE